MWFMRYIDNNNLIIYNIFSVCTLNRYPVAFYIRLVHFSVLYTKFTEQNNILFVEKNEKKLIRNVGEILHEMLLLGNN